MDIQIPSGAELKKRYHNDSGWVERLIRWNPLMEVYDPFLPTTEPTLKKNPQRVFWKIFLIGGKLNGSAEKSFAGAGD